MIHNYIETRAEKFLIECNALSVPVDVKYCAETLNVRVKAVELDEDVSGFLVFNGNQAHIGYNRTHGEHRHRFTIAHEIGHYLLHKNSNKLFIEKKQSAHEKVIYRNNNSSTGEYVIEREANSFAAALLMPRKLVEKELAQSHNLNNPDALISELADLFNVSAQAMRIRLTNLGIIDYDDQ